MADTPMTSPDLLHAAGAVIWRGEETAPEILLVHRPRGDWTFPKGKTNHGEHVIAASVREVFEETGYEVTLGRWLQSIHYDRSGWTKRVDYWATRAEGPAKKEFVPNEEIDKIEWMPLDEAQRALTHKRDIAVLKEFTARPVATTPIILARHGQLAGSKKDWEGKGKIRPLDHVGEAQAANLATVLAAYRPTKLISAPSDRCLLTLSPYALATGREIRTEKVLTKKHFEPAGALRVVLDAMEASDATAICAYRESIEGVIPEVCKTRYVGDDTVQVYKGSFVVLHHVNGRIASLERYTV
ncbi:NUDIX hydrolase [Acrocarpospora sp. B8E8]|uniref:bifunctional NUDIX hydrolase/histidine phosphatase family protein n=1 Tax=Acrocarpospora sp. B8E8 TaxID=3153572 RepID=UPI00325C8C0A